MISRRGFLGGLLAAPAIIKIPGLLMPVKAWDDTIYREVNITVAPPPQSVVICAPETNPISGPWRAYGVAPGERIYRGDLVVMGPDGYVRAGWNSDKTVAGHAVTDSYPTKIHLIG